MCEIQFVEWKVIQDPETGLPCLKVYYTLNYGSKIWEHKYYFDELLDTNEDENLRSVIYNMIIDRDSQYISCDDEWMRPAHQSDHLLEDLQQCIYKVCQFEMTLEDFWAKWKDFSFS